ncbi:MAG TPA: CPXCG motif-containing cysteine-rich protein [Gemmatimonadaceae bacterium]|nr:CPXCG motif-containing cysteine-rich protein [Gemmatimonadaceae bacterium]
MASDENEFASNGNGETDDDDLDEDFPLGDGTVDDVSVVECPYCGEPVEISLDPGSGEYQEYVEDCAVCCRPWQVTVTYDKRGAAHVEVISQDD